MTDNTIRDQLAAAIDTWPNRQWLVLPGPMDLASELAAHLSGSLAGWRPPARVITTAAIANEPTGTVLRSAHGDVASVDHGGSGEWLGHSTKVHFLDFAEPWWEFVMHLPDGQWSVLWQPEVDRV
ncbi:hypothetical protein [Nocardia sp. NPDC059239]|uniref:hypothetical protein n=1 Tax=unclassified Nocardia TaxID=2637762 RepID=UPI00367A5CDE